MPRQQQKMATPTRGGRGSSPGGRGRGRGDRGRGRGGRGKGGRGKSPQAEQRQSPRIIATNLQLKEAASASKSSARKRSLSVVNGDVKKKKPQKRQRKSSIEATDAEALRPEAGDEEEDSLVCSPVATPASVKKSRVTSTKKVLVKKKVVKKSAAKVRRRADSVDETTASSSSASSASSLEDEEDSEDDYCREDSKKPLLLSTMSTPVRGSGNILSCSSSRRRESGSSTVAPTYDVTRVPYARVLPTDVVVEEEQEEEDDDSSSSSSSSSSRHSSNSVLLRVRCRERWILAIDELIALSDEAARRSSLKVDAEARTFESPVSRAFVEDRLALDDPLYGWMARERLSGKLQGFLLATTFTTWVAPENFRWLPDSHALNKLERAGDPLTTGCVWPKVAELSLVAALGCGAALVRALLQRLRGDDHQIFGPDGESYEYVVLQATKNAVHFYEKAGFEHVASEARHFERIDHHSVKGDAVDPESVGPWVPFRHFEYIAGDVEPSFMMALDLTKNKQPKKIKKKKSEWPLCFGEDGTAAPTTATPVGADAPPWFNRYLRAVCTENAHYANSLKSDDDPTKVETCTLPVKPKKKRGRPRKNQPPSPLKEEEEEQELVAAPASPDAPPPPATPGPATPLPPGVTLLSC